MWGFVSFIERDIYRPASASPTRVSERRPRLIVPTDHMEGGFDEPETMFLSIGLRNEKIVQVQIFSMRAPQVSVSMAWQSSLNQSTHLIADPAHNIKPDVLTSIANCEIAKVRFF